MNDIAYNIFAFVIGLGFLIFIHEAGHFFVAKLFGVRVLVFSFGFGKRLFGFRHGDTDYRVSIFPLGGYVRMAGDSPEENVPANPDEFLSKPKWQRFLILFAGPFMNIVVAIAFVATLSMIGTEQFVIKPVIGHIEPNQPAARAGLQVGDRITRVKGETVKEFDDIRLLITMHAGTPLPIEYVRNGELRKTILTPDQGTSEYGPIGRAGIRPMIDPVVGRVKPGSPAALAGLRPGDRLLSANGKPVSQGYDFEQVSEASKGAPIALELQRGAQRIRTTLGGTKDPEDIYRGFIPPTEIRKLTLFPALKDSVYQNWRMLKYAMTAVGRMFRSEGSVKELSGPLSIARISGDMLRRGPFEFLALLAMISLQLGVMNLLPIPVLDGGHIMILLIEGIARRDLSLRVKERIQQLGFAALATLMIVVLYNDVITNVLRLKNG
ncbi:MAG TPA: RIP metalloprotease RseP [Thermoanaerobaculia bacterium]|nr:RIP metalloprotease RseP [Thermoanaerobaculia bacterium]